MEAIYGVDYFPQLWNEWSDAILKVTAIRVVEFHNSVSLLLDQRSTEGRFLKLGQTY